MVLGSADEGVRPSGQRWRKYRCLNELCLANSFAARIVKEHRVPVGFPNRGEFDAPRAVQAEENAAGPRAANENAFGNGESADFEFVLMANGLMDVRSQVCQVVKLERLSRHWGRTLLVGKNDTRDGGTAYGEGWAVQGECQ
jgi:hypothetical protein